MKTLFQIMMPSQFSLVLIIVEIEFFYYFLNELDFFPIYFVFS